MSRWKAKIGELIDGADNFSDKIRARLRKFKGFDEPLMIVPYLGYGTREKFFIGGRVLEDKGAITTNETDGRRRNLINLYKRFDTDEVPFARIRAAVRGVERGATAGE